jgi:formate dehydrogenase major subunit
MTRNISLLNELMPAMFVMMSLELAKRLGVKVGDHVVVSTDRGDIEARAHVTRASGPNVGKLVEVISLPWRQPSGHSRAVAGWPGTGRRQPSSRSGFSAT